MKRRALLQTMAAVMALPAYRTAQLIKDFGLPIEAPRILIRRTGYANYLVSPELMAQETLRILKGHLVQPYPYPRRPHQSRRGQ